MERFATPPLFTARLGAAPPAMREHRQGVAPTADGEKRRVPFGLRRGRPIRDGARLADSARYRLRRAPGVSADRARNAAAPITRTGS